MKRQRGILEVTFHTNGGSLHWSEKSHHELGLVFKCISSDRDNRIIIMTGVGDNWSGPGQLGLTRLKSRPRAEEWDDIIYFGRQLRMNMLEIEVPVIFALNGPPHHHAELPLLADIVIASDTTVFGDVGHFSGGALAPATASASSSRRCSAPIERATFNCWESRSTQTKHSNSAW